MVDDMENVEDVTVEESDFPSFLRSDNSENYKDDVNHFLDDDTTKDVSVDVSAWADGFDDIEKSEDNLDLNLDGVKLDLTSWDEFEEDSFLKNPDDINMDSSIDFDIFEDKKETSDSQEISISENVDEDHDNSSPEIKSEEIEEENTVKYVDPEEYMSGTSTLEELSNEETLMEELSEEDLIPPADSIKKASPKNISNTFIDDLPAEDFSNNGVSLLVPLVPLKKKNDGTIISNFAKEQKKQIEILQMFKRYAGNVRDIYFDFSKDSTETAFAGNAVQNSIYVNVETSAYGWNVAFDNGVNMNLMDVREFQLRNGRLPADSGTLSYGNKKLRFSKVQRIVVALRAEYFHYGV